MAVGNGAQTLRGRAALEVDGVGKDRRHTGVQRATHTTHTPHWHPDRRARPRRHVSVLRYRLAFGPAPPRPRPGPGKPLRAAPEAPPSPVTQSGL